MRTRKIGVYLVPIDVFQLDLISETSRIGMLCVYALTGAEKRGKGCYTFHQEKRKKRDVMPLASETDGVKL